MQSVRCTADVTEIHFQMCCRRRPQAWIDVSESAGVRLAGDADFDHHELSCSPVRILRVGEDDRVAGAEILRHSVASSTSHVPVASVCTSAFAMLVKPAVPGGMVTFAGVGAVGVHRRSGPLVAAIGSTLAGP